MHPLQESACKHVSYWAESTTAIPMSTLALDSSLTRGSARPARGKRQPKSSPACPPSDDAHLLSAGYRSVLSSAFSLLALSRRSMGRLSRLVSRSTPVVRKLGAPVLASFLCAVLVVVKPVAALSDKRVTICSLAMGALLTIWLSSRCRYAFLVLTIQVLFFFPVRCAQSALPRFAHLLTHPELTGPPATLVGRHGRRPARIDRPRHRGRAHRPCLVVRRRRCCGRAQPAERRE